MSSPSRPSTKGYAPVPAEERIDDDLLSAEPVAEADDDEELYTTSAPLLSSRTRGNEPPLDPSRSRWYHNIGSWRPFRRSRHYASWDAPRKPRTWRQIIMYTFVGFLILAVIAFATATGILAHDTLTCNRGSQYNRIQSYRTSNVPFGDKQKSYNGHLNFPKMYPPMNRSSKSACQDAWESFTFIPCHEKIWNRSWDNGKSSLFAPDIGVYTEAICEARGCTRAIILAHRLISARCSEDDTFDMSNYRGPFAADPELESGPAAVLNTINKRLTHTCRQSPSGQDRWYTLEPPYCTFNLWNDWAIVDGMHAGNLEGLSNFESRTRVTRFESRNIYYHGYTDTCDGITHRYGERAVQARNFGPTRNSTTCDWCTMDWFERKLLSWKEGEAKDPETGEVVGLKEYLKRIQRLGERCEADAWDRAWARALRKYKLAGQLPHDWEWIGESAVLEVEKLTAENVDVDGFVHVLPVSVGAET